MVDQVDDHKLSIRASVLVWVCLSFVGWAALVGIGYSAYNTSEDIIARWRAPDAATPAVEIAESADREVPELQRIAPAVGGEPAAK